MRGRHRVTHLQKSRLPGDPTRVADMSGMNLLPSSSYKHALLPCHPSSIYHASNFVKGWQMSEFIMSWLGYLWVIYMEVNLPWPGSLSPSHLKLYHWQQVFQMLGSSGIRRRRWKGITMSLTSKPGSWMSSQEYFLLDTWRMSMLHSWCWSWNTSVVRGGSLECMPIISIYSCTSPGWGWWTSHFSYART